MVNFSISMEELRRENQLQKEELKRLQKVISQEKDKNNVSIVVLSQSQVFVHSNIGYFCC